MRKFYISGKVSGMSEVTAYLKKHSLSEPAKVVICMSGTGSNAEVLLRHSAAGAEYKVVLIFTDAPESSRAEELSKMYNVPLESLDIREFYRDHGEESIRLDSPERRKLRNEWSERVWQIISAYDVDFAVFAGFVPLTNLAEKLPALNVHPGDLTVEKDGKRVYAGLHFEPVERAILDNCRSLRSSVILVQTYSGNGKEDLDGGPVLGISSPVEIDLQGNDLTALQEAKDSRTFPPYKDVLRQTALFNMEKLKENGDHVVLPQTVANFAAGRYGVNKNAELCFLNDSGRWQKVGTVEYSADTPSVPREVKMPAKVKAGKFIRFCKYMYTKIVRGSGSPDYIARGWALGMFVGCVIPVFCQLIIAVPLSFVFRGSKVGAALGTFITTPPTAIFIYPVQIWLGNKIINGDLSPDAAKNLLAVFNSETLSFAEKWSAFADMGGALVGAFFAGGLLWAAVMTPLTYFGVRYLVVRYRKMREKLFAAKKRV